MRSISVDVNSELTVALRKIRGEWKWVWSGEHQYKNWQHVMKAVADEINRTKGKHDERMGDLIFALMGIAAQNGTPKKGSC